MSPLRDNEAKDQRFSNLPWPPLKLGGGTKIKSGLMMDSSDHTLTAIYCGYSSVVTEFSEPPTQKVITF